MVFGFGDLFYFKEVYFTEGVLVRVKAGVGTGDGELVRVVKGTVW